MRIEKNGRPITCLSEWKALAPPKSKGQWVEGGSTFGLANAWCGSGVPAMPAVVREILDSHDETRGMIVESVVPEHQIRFDTQGGEPRNADLALRGHAAGSKVVITIEAKADERSGLGQVVRK